MRGLFLGTFHELQTNGRDQDQCNDRRKTVRENNGKSQISKNRVRELASKGERDENDKGSNRACNNRKSNLRHSLRQNANALAERNSSFDLIEVTKNIFHDDDGTIDVHSGRQRKTAER